MKYSDHIRHYQIDGQYYDYFAYNKFMREEIRRRYQEILSLARLRQNDRILEIGSGGGQIIPELGKLSCHYIPLDISFNNLNRISKTYQVNESFRLQPVSADVYHLPFNNEQFDSVIMSEVLEHLAEPLPALVEIHRVLKTGGTLVISVPYKEIITYQICIHCNKPTPSHAHLHSFDESSLQEMVSAAEFRPQRFSKNLNKVPNRLSINLMLKSLLFRLWKMMDNAFNFLIDKPTSIILLSKK